MNRFNYLDSVLFIPINHCTLPSYFFTEISIGQLPVPPLNSNLTNKADKSALVDKNQFMYAYNAADWKVLLGLENGWLFVRIVNINTGVNVYNGKVQLTSF